MNEFTTTQSLVRFEISYAKRNATKIGIRMHMFQFRKILTEHCCYYAKLCHTSKYLAMEVKPTRDSILNIYTY